MWNQRALTEAPVSPAKLALVAAARDGEVRRVDGLKDGLIDDPRRVRLRSGARRARLSRRARTRRDCLTPAQAATLKKVYGGPMSNGKPFFPGFMYGSEAVTARLRRRDRRSGWMNVIVAGAARAPSRPTSTWPKARCGIWCSRRRSRTTTTTTFDFDRDTGLLDAWGKLAERQQPGSVRRSASAAASCS